jgi:hypothetical protein
MDRTLTSLSRRDDGGIAKNVNGPGIDRVCIRPLTRDSRETVVQRAKRDPAFTFALLTEALQSFLEGEVGPGLILLGDCINAAVGFGVLSKERTSTRRP